MRIGLDLDGVIYQFDKTAQYMIAKHRGLRLREHQDWDHTQYWRGVDRAEWDWLWKEEQTDALFRHGHLYRGSIEFVQDLNELGQIVIVTKRPITADAVTHEWLSFHFPSVYRDLEVHILQAGSKSEVEVDVLIDDLDRNTAGAKALGRYAILMDRPWNTRASRFTYDVRCGSFERVLEEVRYPQEWERLTV